MLTYYVILFFQAIKPQLFLFVHNKGQIQNRKSDLGRKNIRSAYMLVIADENKNPPSIYYFYSKCYEVYSNRR